MFITSANRANFEKVRKTPSFQALAPQGPIKEEDEHTHRHTVKAQGLFFVNTSASGLPLALQLHQVRTPVKKITSRNV